MGAGERKFLLTLLTVSGVACAFILLPFLTTLALGAAFAVALYPIFSWLSTHGISRPWAASLLTVILFVCALGIPLFFLGSSIATQAHSLYVSLTDGNALEKLTDAALSLLGPYAPRISDVNVDVQQLFGSTASSVSGILFGFFSSTVHAFLTLFLTLLSLFYFLKDGKSWVRATIEASPLADTRDVRVLERLAHSINGVLRGYVLIAIAQGFLMGVGLWLFDVPNAALWGLVAGVASIIPSIGTSFVSIPTIVYLLLMGSPFGAIGFAAWALGLVASIDNLLSPYVMGKNTGLSPLSMLFGVLGGIATFGAVGILMGPLILSFFQALLSIYREGTIAE